VDGPALPESVIAGQLRAIAKAGAGSVRWALNWSDMQPYRSWADVPAARRQDFSDAGGIPTDFRASDRFLAAAVRAHVEPLPVVVTAAPWIAENPFVVFSPPVDMAAFGRFAGTLAARYGARGSFWRAHRELPRRPIRTWQIWNEPAGLDGFHSPSWVWESTGDALRGYIAMLRAARRDLRAADPHARVMLSGLFGRSWLALSQLYRAGAQDLFDAVAIHPFTRKLSDVVRILRAVRRVMARHGDADKPLVVTELAWPSAAGRVSSPLRFDVTRREQAALLTRAFKLLARERRGLRLRAVYWYTWMTLDASSKYNFDYAGLLTRTPDGRLRRKPAFRAFRRTARQLTGAPVR
jgi:hypothetical protein